MSTRTIIEINHDHLRPSQLEELKDLFNTLGGSTIPTLLAKNDGKPFNWSSGIKIVMQRHHSTDVKITTEYQEISL